MPKKVNQPPEKGWGSLVKTLMKVVRDTDSWPFDPEGKGYDYLGAMKAGLWEDESGHWGSRDPRSGLIFKGTGHKTFHKTKIGEHKAGYELFKKDDGRTYSRPRYQSLPVTYPQRYSGTGQPFGAKTPAGRPRRAK